jgi:protein Tex
MTTATSEPATLEFAPLVAEEMRLPAGSVAAAVRLLEEGSTVPFIARYRKEATGSLDEVQIRTIQERCNYLKDLAERRATVLKTIQEQGKLTPDLERRIAAVTTKAELEDLYLPFRPKRRTRAQVAREQGLEPLAQKILAQESSGDPKAEAAKYVDAAKGVADVDAALQGARDIVAETVSEHADLRRLTREHWANEAFLVSERVESKAKEPTRFQHFYDFREAIVKIPSHRFLAVRRGEQEGVLKVHLEADEARLLPKIEAAMGLDAASPFAGELKGAIEDGYRRLLMPSIETELRVDLKQRSDRMAVEVFADNLANLLLAPPLGGKAVIGIDPGLRTGCKCVAVDATGKFMGSTTIHPARDLEKAKAGLARFILEHPPIAIAVGNGTGGRDAEALVRKLVAEIAADPAKGKPELKETVVVSVNEAGASVYSASDVARAEFPKLDVTVRGAISIARRLQDPLAELVKIDPKSIGVGQYQHDVHAPMLSEKLDEVVESCVNQVGVELNTASAPLLARVSGIGSALATKIVQHRDEKGAFKGRSHLTEVGGLGPKTFEQCAGFLRIRDAEHPLDASAVHPERYSLVERMAQDLGRPLAELVGNAELVDKIDVKRYVGDDVGEPTLRDILDELKKPGRDPRRQFEPPRFRDDVTTPADLKPGMALEGVVTNVTVFGAFVDVGVHQDGLVHVSQLADRFVKDPREVVKVGDKVNVRVLEVDLERGRISLTCKREAAKGDDAAGPGPAAGAALAASGAAPTSAPPGETRRDERRGGRGRGDGARRDERGRPPRDRDRDAGPPPPTVFKPPPPKPLTPKDATRPGHNNPLGDLLKGLFEKNEKK